ncbi:MAG: hypothetical protein RLZZ309_309 [Bacteroidota bacterium]|jgi:hypothetical protein
MQLNESTYETIFLLYIDNELSPKERLEVEVFIADNPSYALEMEALKATVLIAENMPYAFKENLKQQEVETSLEDLEKDWDANYATLIKEDMHAITGLSTSFKNTLKKEATKEGIVLKPLGFSQQKFAYAAIAACLMVFFGYQQLTKTPVSDFSAANANVVSNSNQPANIVEPVATKKQTETKNLQASKSSKKSNSYKFQNASIAIAEPTLNKSNLNNQPLITKLASTYNNPIAIDETPLAIASTNLDAATTEEEKASTSYELVDTEDPNRTIMIANFEIDGAAFRGITRRVSALLKRNKSEKEK